MNPHPPRLRRAWIFALAAAVTLGAGVAAHATPLAYVRADRSVVAEFQISTQRDFDADTAVAAADGFGPFDAGVTVAGGTLGTAAEAWAAQESVLLETAIWGSGRTGAGTWVEVDPAFLFGRGESLLQVVFAVASDTRFLLGGELGVSEDEIADGFASFELVDLAAGTTVSEVMLDSGGRLPIAATGVLRAGVPYALTATARANAASTSVAGSDFAFELVLVPETGGAVLATLAIGAALARRRGEDDR
jgi:hypothetical protein